MGAKGELVCLSAGNGHIYWQRPTLEDSHGAIPMWGFAGSPLIVDDLAIVFAGGKQADETRKSLLAYHLDDGKLAWSADAGYGSFSSPQLATVAGKRVVLFVGEPGLMAFDLASGERLWTAGEKHDGESHSLQPHVWSSEALGERMYVVSSQGTG